MGHALNSIKHTLNDLLDALKKYKLFTFAADQVTCKISTPYYYRRNLEQLHKQCNQKLHKSYIQKIKLLIYNSFLAWYY